MNIPQAEAFFTTWKYLGVVGHSAPSDRLAVLNILLFSVSFIDGSCCPRRPHDFMNRVMGESLVTPGHLDLWMKDLSPEDSRVRNIDRAGEKEGRGSAMRATQFRDFSL